MPEIRAILIVLLQPGQGDLTGYKQEEAGEEHVDAVR
jgi:hypothetical protein